MRLEGPSEAIREVFPAEYAELAVLVTDLGGTTFLMVLLAVLFWLSRRRETALVASYAVAGLGLLMVLKALFDLPRPPEELFLASMDDDPYGFPSGHAFAAVVVYGGLLVAFERLREPLAVAGVGSLVVLVSLSRVVLGYHYLGDVIVGAAVGIAFLAAMFRTVSEPRIGFAVGLVLALPAIAATGAAEETLLGLGAAIGGLVGTWRLDSAPPLRSRAEGALLAVAGLAFLTAMTAMESWIAVTAPATVATYAVTIAGIFLLPVLLARVGIERPVIRGGSRPG
ncbi:phosphatase PAP2 family protein [Halovivax sp.]|uniref:phosphatase PAP2 family protein n=1 Tax=Halovivax sp. TaxID=1935978 RepID=UPI0025C6D6B2|nr:phosphatase PAP2 family protein [Halovivax sp.]